MDEDPLSTSLTQTPIRAQDLQRVLDYLKYGDTCCSLVAPSNMGKSLLLRSLQTEAVRQRLVAGGDPPVVVFIDCLPIGDEKDGRAFYDLVARRIAEALPAAAPDAAVFASLDAVREAVFALADPSRALRHPAAVQSWFDSHIRRLLRTTDITLVLILDEFDDTFRFLKSPAPFNHLVALKEEFPEQLRYLVATSRSLKGLRRDDAIYEFRELFHLSTHVLRPLDRDDAHRLITYLADKHNGPNEELYAFAAIELSGGHPGLLERIYRLLAFDPAFKPDEKLQDLATRLLHKEPILKECQRLWSELEEEEQEELIAFVSGSGSKQTAERFFAASQAKGLIVSHSSNPAIFSPVFQLFVESERAHEGQAKHGIHCDLGAGRIWIDDQDVTTQIRSDLQRNLLFLLYEKEGEVCTYEEIAERLYGSTDNIDEKQIQAVLSRLRSKFKLKQDEYIISIEGAGYCLENPSEE